MKALATIRISPDSSVAETLKVADGENEQDRPRPQLSFRSNDEEILREVCLNNGINFKRLSLEGPQTKVLEMFFSGYPRLTGMHYFPNLTTLTVIGQSVCCLEGLSASYNLEELWVAECKLTKIEGLDKCKALTNLYLYGNNISVIENISHLTNIRVLWLNNNQIRNIENLYTLTKLKELNIAENMIRKIGNSLTYNTQLEDLNLSGNPLWSLRELTCLVKLENLIKLSLKDPLYHPCPASQLCNYSTHIMYHLPNLVSLDTMDITSKQLADLAEGTVNKKKMFYNMRSKTIQRNMSNLLSRLEITKKQVLEAPHKKLRSLNFMIKEIVKESDAENLLDVNDSDPESEREVKKPADKMSVHSAKLELLKQRQKKWETKCCNIESFGKMYENRIRLMADMMINRLLVELETGGNVRFEDGQASDPWFSSCHDLVLSRFCAFDYRELGVTGIKIHHIIRIHNRMLRIKFDKSIIALTESSKGEYYPGVNKNTSYKKSLEYLFWMSDPEMMGGSSESYRIPEEGFLDSATYMQLGREGAVPLSNSISLADRRRIAYCIKLSKEREEIENCPFRYGQLIVAKTHLGKSVVVKEGKHISKENYPKMDSVFKPRKSCVPKNKVTEENDCECSARQCEWYIFNNNLVLPEYIIEFEYVSKFKSLCPFQHLSEDLLSEQPCQVKNVPMPECVESGSDSDDELLKMEPEIRSRSKIMNLTDKFFLKSSKLGALHNITSLNLHGSGLAKLRHMNLLVNLKKLVISFNELVKLDELANMHRLQFIDASFNQIYTLEGMKGLSNIEELDVSWNKLLNTREELSILRKHLTTLRVLDIRNNPWLKAKDLRLRAIGRLKNLQELDGKHVAEAEIALALRCAAGSRISQLSLLTYSRTDTEVPRSLSLGDSNHNIISISRNRPVKENEDDVSWLLKITTLTLDSQHITKLSNLDKLVNLKYASFNNNDLTRIEGLEHCTQLTELSMSNNCIAHLEGLRKLASLQHLDLSHNCLTSIDTSVLTSATILTFLAVESNRLTSLNGLQKSSSLVELYIGNNNINNIREVFLLKSLPNLVILDMYGNPMVSEVENYRLFVIYHLRSLKALDGSAIGATEGNIAKDMFGGRLTSDFIAEKLGHASFLEVQELDFPNAGIRVVDLGNGELFKNLRSVNLEQNNLQSFTGLTHLVNLKVLCLNNNHIECIMPKSKTASDNQVKNRTTLPGNNKNIDSNCADSLSPILPNLEVLHLGWNGIRDLVALQLSRLPSLKTLFLPGNEITKVEGLDELRNLRGLVLDRNKIRQLSEDSFVNQCKLQELHLEDNRLQNLTGLDSLTGLSRLFLGANRIQDLSEMEKLEAMQNLIEISLVNNAVTRRSAHRLVLIHHLPRLKIIDSLSVTYDERVMSDLYYAEQDQLQVQLSPLCLDPMSPSTNSQFKPNVQVKVTNMQLTPASHWSNILHNDEDSGNQRGNHIRRQMRDLPRQMYGLPGEGGASSTSANSNRMPYSQVNHMLHPSSIVSEVMENVARSNQQKTNKR